MSVKEQRQTDCHT